MKLEHKITIPTGTYEIQDIVNFIQNHDLINGSRTIFHLNKNTFKMEVKSSMYIDFTSPNSIGGTLGFSKRVLPPNHFQKSDLPVKIFTVSTVKVKCNLIKCNVHNFA